MKEDSALEIDIAKGLKSCLKHKPQDEDELI